MGRKRVVYHFLGYDEDTGGMMTAMRHSFLSSREYHTALIVAPSFRFKREPTLKAVRVRTVDSESITLRGAFYALRHALCLWRFFYGSEHRVFEGNSRQGILVAFLLVLFGCDNVVVSTHHGTTGPKIFLYRLIYLFFPGRSVFLTPRMKDDYEGTDYDRWPYCQPAGQPLHLDPPWQRRVRARGRDEPLVVGGMGMVVAWKGWHVVVEGLSCLPFDLRESVRFRHIGSVEGDSGRAYFQSLEDAVERYSLGRVVSFEGWYPDPRGFLQEIDILVMPSFDEPFGLVVTEALRAGKPVLISDSCYVHRMLRPGRDKFTFRSGSPEDFGRVLAGILREPDCLRSMPPDRPPVLDKVDAQKVAARWGHFYEDCAGSPPVI